jgi:hypothetical protein
MADNAVCQGFEGRSISLPAKVWGLLERVKTGRQDPTYQTLSAFCSCNSWQRTATLRIGRRKPYASPHGTD